MARKVNITIELEGNEVSPYSHFSLHQSINGHHQFELRCPIMEKESALTNAANTAIGKELKVEITAGQSSNSEKHLFQGIITRVALSKYQGSGDEIVYSGFSKTILMDDGPHCQSFTEKTLRDIAKDVAGKYSQEVQISTHHTAAIPYVVQYDESGFHFISRLAQLYGEWFYHDGMKTWFGATEETESLDLEFGRDLFKFDLALNLIPSKFKWMAYDHVGHQFPESASSSLSVQGLDDYGRIVSRASNDVYANEPMTITHEMVQNRSELDELVTSRKSAKSADYVVFNGVTDNHRLKLGRVFKVKGTIGSPTGAKTEVSYGEFRVISLSHSVDTLGNYQNNFRAVPASLEKPPRNLQVIEPIAEVQPAEVKENNDPEKLGRIKVELLWQKENGETTPFIRVAATGAGGSHGSYFVPEKGDQVLVAFEHGNPNLPYILGSLYHGKSKPKGADPKNHTKSLRTRSGNEIELGDEGGKETIKITNGTNTIILDLGAKKITISSSDGTLELNAKTININAVEKLSLNGKDIEITAEKKLNGSATDTKFEGSKSIEASGGAGKFNGSQSTSVGTSSGTTKVEGSLVNVEGTGIVEVKGTMVKLN